MIFLHYHQESVVVQCLSWSSSLFNPGSCSSSRVCFLRLVCFGYQQNGCLLLLTHLYHHLLAGYKQNARFISIEYKTNHIQPPTLMFEGKSPAIYGSTIAVVCYESLSTVSSINQCHKSLNHHHFTTSQLSLSTT